MKDDTFELESIELVYGNEEKSVVERVEISDASSKKGVSLDIVVTENTDPPNQAEIRISLEEWTQRLVQLIQLHVKNRTTMSRDMFDAIKQINEDADSPFKGMIQMPDEGDILFNRESSD